MLPTFKAYIFLLNSTQWLHVLCTLSLLVFQSMISSFRVSELQVLLGFAGRNRSGRKHELLLRTLHLLKNGCSRAVQVKIKDLYRQRFPKTIDASLPDLASIKTTFFSTEGSVCVVNSDLSLSLSHSSDSELSSRDWVVESGTEPRMTLQQQQQQQQQAPLIPPVHPDVLMKSLPFYDVLDVLIKPSSLG